MPQKLDQPGRAADRPNSKILELERVFSLLAETPTVLQSQKLDELCVDEDLRKYVQTLFKADAATDLLDHSLFPVAVPKRVGDRIGNYHLLKEIGEGGMGVVFLAEQITPIQRLVALKVIKPGVNSREVIARFEIERQVLSMMEHPNIAKVLDVGTTKGERPFIVMELVDGVPITEYCQSKRLSTNQKLELFLTVCKAIQHAHQKGIIHRDIKPTNVLITEYGGQPVAKVIDFGVAKAINQTTNDVQGFTSFGQIIGTFDYMSPEQSRPHQLDVDTRSDIYSLGVLLYELLAGVPPFAPDRLQAASWEEKVKIIREEDPPEPSARSKENSRSDSPSSGSSTNAHRAMTSDWFSGRELDWIVMKAIEKDPDRRYSTPNELVADIERFIKGDSVSACPPSAIYRIRKFTRRNRIAILTTGIVAASLILGLVGTSWQMMRATAAEATARKAFEKEIAQRIKAEQAEQKAREEAATAKAISDFLQIDLLGLASGDAQVQAGIKPNPDMKVATLLKRAEDRIDSRFAGDPSVNARLKLNIADSYHNIGKYDEAVSLYESAIDIYLANNDPEEEQVLDALNGLAVAYSSQSRYAEAAEITSRLLKSRRAAKDTDPEKLLGTMNNLAILHRRHGEYAKAERLFKEALDFQKDLFREPDSQTARIMGNLAAICQAQRRNKEAERYYLRSLEIRRRVLPADHPEIALALQESGRFLVEFGRKQKMRGSVSEGLARVNKAVKFLNEAVDLYTRVKGNKHPDTVSAKSMLALGYIVLGRIEEAEALLLAGHEHLVKTLGRDHEHTINCGMKLGLLYLEQQRYSESIDYFEKTLAFYRRLPNKRRTLDLMQTLARLYRSNEQPDKAESLDEEIETIQSELKD